MDKDDSPLKYTYKGRRGPIVIIVLFAAALILSGIAQFSQGSPF